MLMRVTERSETRVYGLVRQYNSDLSRSFSITREGQKGVKQGKW